MAISKNSDSFALSIVRRMVTACCEFESALESGERPQIEDFLLRVPASERHVLFSDLLDIELEHLGDVDRPAKVNEYRQRFPDYADIVQQILGPADDTAPRRFGDYDVVRELGRGGMGIVYEARHRVLEKRAAVKVLPQARMLDARSRARFQNEARAAAQLEHPHIVPVHSFGREHGVDYYVMQFVQGRNLAQLIRSLRSSSGAENLRDVLLGEHGRRSDHIGTNDPTVTLATSLPPKTRVAIHDARVAAERLDMQYFRFAARLILNVGQALQHAHDMGIVHRDIKPSNLLLDVHDHVWILDFGLAQIQGEPALTYTGDFVGTLRYMSPEQALAKRVIVDHRTDIYSLGVTFYELLTLRPAFDGESSEEVVRQMMFADPIAPRRIARSLPRDLETIVMKAMSKRPDDRYQSAAELCEDLQRFLDDIPIRAKPPTLVQRGAKWARRHRAAVASLLAIWMVVFISAIVTTIVVWQSRQVTVIQKNRTQQALVRQKQLSKDLQGALRQTEIQRQIADDERERAEGLLLAHEASELAVQDPERALLLALESHKRNPGFASNSALFAALRTYHGVRTLHGHRGPVRGISVSPDKTRLVTASEDHTAIIWRTDTGAPQSLLTGHLGWVRTACFSPDGRRVVTASNDGTAMIWDAESGARLTALTGHRGFVWDAMFSPNSALVATTSNDGTARLWDAETGRQLHELSSHQSSVYSMAFNRDGTKLVTGGGDKIARIWDVATGAQLQQFQPHGAGVGIAEFNSDGTRVLTIATRDMAEGEPSALVPQSSAWIWNAATGALLLELPHSTPVKAACFNNVAQQIITGTADGTICVWDSTTGERLYESRVDDSAIRMVAATPDGKRILAATERSGVRCWNAESGAESLLAGHNEVVNAIAIISSNAVATASRDHTTKVWELDAPGLLPTKSNSFALARTVFSADERRVLIGLLPTTMIGLFSVPDGAPVAELMHESAVIGFLFNESGTEIATMTEFGVVRIWSAARGQLLRTIDGAGIANQFAFVDDRLVIASSEDKLLTLWQRDRDEPIHSTRFTNMDSIALAGFPPKVLAWSSAARAAEIWDVTGRQIGTFGLMVKSPEDFPFFMKSPDGRTVVHWTFQQKSPQLWDLEQERLIGTLPDDAADGRIISFSADGSTFVTGSPYSPCHVWNARTAQRIATLAGYDSSAVEIFVNRDGSRIVTRSEDKVARLWDGATGKSIVILSARNDAVHFGNSGVLATINDGGSELVFWDAERGSRISRMDCGPTTFHSVVLSPGGQFSMICSADGSARVWPVYPAKAVENQVRRKLTPDELDLYEIGDEAERITLRAAMERQSLIEWLKLVDDTPISFEGQQQFVFSTIHSALQRYTEGLSTDRGSQEVCRELAQVEQASRKESYPSWMALAAFGKTFYQLGDAERAEPLLSEAIMRHEVTDPNVWSTWAACLMAGKGRSPAEILERFPNSTSAIADDYRWLFQSLKERGVLRINAGGDDLVDREQHEWRHDCFFQGGRRFNEIDGVSEPATMNIGATEDDLLYQTERWFEEWRPAQERAYAIPLPPGHYRVILHFAEIAFEPPGRRIFDVFAEGHPVIDDFDTLAIGFAVADRQQFELDVNDGILNLEFRGVRDNPKISALEVLAIEETTN